MRPHAFRRLFACPHRRASRGMKKKNLAILMRARMRAAANQEPLRQQQLPQPAHPSSPPHQDNADENNSTTPDRATLKDVKEWMRACISIPDGKLEPVDANLEEFSQGYLTLDQEGRRELLHALARDYDVNRARVRDLMRQYLSLDPHVDATGDQESTELEDEGVLAAFYRTERNLRDALKPTYAVFFERLNERPGGLKLLAILRADLLSVLA